jgi:O-acetylhomoserine/O-acetylserine sulfhydrylase-like pyridoxal-dependent enzyme
VAALEGGVAASRDLQVRARRRRLLAITTICEGRRQHRVAVRSLYGGTYNQFKVTLPPAGHRREVWSMATTSAEFRVGSSTIKTKRASTWSPFGNPRLSRAGLRSNRQKVARTTTASR